MTKKILISTSTFAEFDKEPLDNLAKNNCSVEMNPYKRTMQKEEILSLGKDVVGIIAGTESLDEDVLNKLINLKVISRCGAGIDNVDSAAAKKRGIKILNTPDAPTRAVAELTVGLILNLLRKTNIMDSSLKNGSWKKLMGNLLYEKKVGILGFGRIGQMVSDLLVNFGAEIAYYDIEKKKTLSNCAQKEFMDLLKWADIITMHLSQNKDKKPVIGEIELKAMKKMSWLINVSRGGTVDEDALYQALKSGHLAGAALDVFSKEPYNGLLKELPNVILTPHIGSYAKESRVLMENQAVQNLLNCLSETK